MKTLTRWFGNDIVMRTVIGVLLGLLVVLLFAVPAVRPPVLGVVWLLASYELVRMARRGKSWRLWPQWLIVSGGIAVVMVLFGQSWQWTLVLAMGVVATDVMALVVGRLAKAVPGYTTHRFSMYSPSKTWEGAIGGIAGSVLAMSSVVVLLGIGMTWYVLLLLMAVPLVAVWGDFFESRLKRDVGVKDTSSLLGPHGGLVDRLDSICAVFATVGFAVIVLLSLGIV